MLRGITNSYKIFTVRKNRNGIYTTIASAYAQETTNIYSVISLTNNIEELKAGDIIEICVGGGATGTLEIAGNNYTYMTVQEI